jgi:hypothetical protein
VDGNANGFFADAADRLWIDLNNDNEWDAITEQFPFSPVLTLNEQRYGMRGDVAGSRLTLEPLTSEGRVRLRLDTLAKDATLLNVEVMLSGEDGSAFTLNALDTSTVVPTGRYAVSAVLVSVQSATVSQPTHFVFSRILIDGDTRWHEVKKDQELTIDPIGKLRFALEIAKDQRVRQPGQKIGVQPQLFTTDGLQINSCCVGESDNRLSYNNHNSCTIKLMDAKQALDVQSSGFA